MPAVTGIWLLITYNYYWFRCHVHDETSENTGQKNHCLLFAEKKKNPLALLFFSDVPDRLPPTYFCQRRLTVFLFIPCLRPAAQMPFHAASSITCRGLLACEDNTMQPCQQALQRHLQASLAIHLGYVLGKPKRSHKELKI